MIKETRKTDTAAVSRINQNVQEPNVKETSEISTTTENPFVAHTTVQRAISNPRNLTPNEILTLQRTIGNRAVQRILKGDTTPLTTQNKGQVNRAFKNPNTINRQVAQAQEKPQKNSVETTPESENVQDESLELANEFSPPKENSFKNSAVANNEAVKDSVESKQIDNQVAATKVSEQPAPAPIPIRRKLATQTIQREDTPSFGQNVKTFLNMTKRGKDTPYDQQTDQEKEHEQWVHGAMMENSPIMAGGPGHLIQYGITHRRFKNQIDARKAAINKNHIIEENMYGDGKIGTLFRIISAASRAMHLVASLAGIGALITGIIGIWHPYVLPISTIFGLIAFAANGALAVLRSILIARNIYRIKKMPGDKDKILPTLYRDLASLLTAVVGMAAGGGFGFGAGAFLHVGSTAALQGAELGIHAGGLATEFAAEGAGATANTLVAFQQGMNEAHLGSKGRFGQTPLSLNKINPNTNYGNARKFAGYFIDAQPLHGSEHDHHNNNHAPVGNNPVPVVNNPVPVDNNVVNPQPIDNGTGNAPVENTPVIPIQDNSVGQDVPPTVPVENTNIPTTVPQDNQLPNIPTTNPTEVIPGEVNKIHLDDGPKPGQTLSRIIHREFDGTSKGGGNSAALEELQKLIGDTQGVATDNRDFLNQRTADLNDAVSGLGEVNQATSKVKDANKVQEVSNQIEEAQSKVENDKDKSKAPKSEQELDKQEQTIQKAEGELGTVGDKDDETPKPKKSIGTKIKEGLRSAKNWLVKRFFSLKKRAAKLMQKLNAKITKVLLKVTGLDKQLAQAEQIANEEKQQAPDTLNALNAGKTSLDQYEQNVEKLKELAGKANGSKK